MRYLKNKMFQRDLKDNGLADEDLKAVLDDIFKGRAVSLGFKMYKVRGASEGKGKRGGFRSLFFWKKNERIIFCLLFTKNEQDNLSLDDKKVLEILAKEYDHLTDAEVSAMVEKNTLKEIRYENE
jgi:hypothetical protein